MPKIVNKDAMRARILGAAQEVFGRDGVAPARMSDIAEIAGLAKGTLYLYFSSKEMLVAAYVDQHFNASLAALRALPETLTLAEFVNEIGQALETAQAHPNTIKPFLAAIGGEITDRQIAGNVATVFDDMGEEIAGHLRRFGLGRAEAREVARTMLAMADGVMLHAALFPSAQTPNAALRRSFLAFLTARLAPTPGRA